MDVDRYGPSILIEAGSEKLLFDCGREASLRLTQAGVSLGVITKIFLTHLHSDHVIGLPDLFLTPWASEAARQVPIHVWGPPGTRDMMDHLQKAFAFDIHVRRDLDERYSAEGIKAVSHEIREGVVFEEEGVKVTAFLVDDAVVKPAFGYRVDYAGHSVVLSGDTRRSENLIRAAAGTNLLIHEVVDAEAELANPGNRTRQQMENIIGHHTTIADVTDVLNRVKPKLAVYSHITGEGAVLVQKTRPAYAGRLEAGEDLMTITVADSITISRPKH
jgi:ribonuclease Z